MQVTKKGQKSPMSPPPVKMVNTDKKWIGFKKSVLGGKR